MTNPDDLLQAIIEDPGDDNLRLVFADLLDDRGEGERASFIRVQCEIAALKEKEIALFNDETDWSQCTGISASWCPNCGDCVCPFPEDEMCSPNCPLHNRHSSHCCLEDIAYKRERLREREVELFNWDWLPDFGGQLREWYFDSFPTDYQPDRPFSYCVSRGFVAEVRCTCADWMQHGPALVRRQPIERVVLIDCKPWQRGAAFEWWRFDSNDNGVNRSDYPCYLPDIIFRHLNKPWSIEWSRYSTEPAALDALSDACLAHARQTEPATASA